MRFPIRVDPIWRSFLLAGGATRRNAYVELTDNGIHFRFGLLFDRTVPYSDVKAAFRRSWPLWYGIGWRSNLRGAIGLIGSYEDIVEVRLKKRTRAWLVFPCDRIAVSVEQPDAFIRAVEERAGLSEDRSEEAPKARRNPAGARRRAPRTKS